MQLLSESWSSRTARTISCQLEVHQSLVLDRVAGCLGLAERQDHSARERTPIHLSTIHPSPDMTHHLQFEVHVQLARITYEEKASNKLKKVVKEEDGRSPGRRECGKATEPRKVQRHHR